MTATSITSNSSKGESDPSIRGMQHYEHKFSMLQGTEVQTWEDSFNGNAHIVFQSIFDLFLTRVMCLSTHSQVCRLFLWTAKNWIGMSLVMGVIK